MMHKKILLLVSVCALASTLQETTALSTRPSKRTSNHRQRVSRNEEAFARRRSDGFKAGKRTRTPRWETEGDALYQEIKATSVGNSNHPVIGLAEASTMLEQLAPSANASVVHRTAVAPTRPPATGEQTTAGESSNKTEKKTAPPHTLWGALPVGPVIKSRLTDSLGVQQQPTPVQTAAFPIIAKGLNAVIASPTGTGKTLAYLLPLLATRNRLLSCGMLVIAPTAELAMQIQREADKLWPPMEDETGTLRSSVHVVGEGRGQDKDESSKLLFSQVGDAPILAGTPRMLRELLHELRAHPSDQTARKIAKALQSNLKTVVLDEADRLLRTEGVARDAAESLGTKISKKPKTTATQCEMLLSDLPVSVTRFQIICASATVGRTLRRQLMSMLNSPSIEKAATLVTADVRATGKNVDKRKSSLIPNTLTHSFRLLDAVAANKGKKNENHDDTLQALCDTLKRLQPAPTLVFPGRVGVDAVQKSLVDNIGLQNVRSLADLKQDVAASSEWQSTPVYVVPDKFGRGLDLPDIANVVLLSPPSSAAGYAHLAGRTGRNGRSGTVITLLRPREAHKLVAISTLLGLSFVTVDSLNAAGKEDVAAVSDSMDAAARTEGETCDQEIAQQWANLSDSGLKRKTVAELREYLCAQGIDLDKEAGKKVLKADLMAAVQKLQD